MRRKKPNSAAPRARRTSRALAAGAAAGFAFLYFTGFCFSELRYVEDAEAIERALLYRAREIKEVAATPTREDARAYIAQHPNCCRIEGSAFFLSSSFLDRLFGFSSTWVRIIHQLTDERAAISPADGNFYEAYVELDRCGNAVRSTGMTVTEEQAGKL
jgi:hypothetical protein